MSSAAVCLWTAKCNLILHGLKEQACRLGVLIVIKRRCVQVCDLLIELPLTQPYFPNLLKLALEVFVREHMPLFQALYVHCPALNGMVFHDLTRPFAELHGPLIIDLEADGNDHLQIKVSHLAADLPRTLCLNYSEFPDSCRFGQFSVRIYLFDMLIDGGKPCVIQCCHHLLCQPYVFILIAHLEADVALAGGGDKGQIFCSRTAQGKLLFLLHRHITAPSLRSKANKSRKSGQSCRPLHGSTEIAFQSFLQASEILLAPFSMMIVSYFIRFFNISSASAVRFSNE